MPGRTQVVVQFLPEYNPSQPKDKSAAKQIRSHIAGTLKRKKLEALLNQTTTSQNTQQTSEGRSFCSCVLAQTAPSFREEEEKKSKALQKQRAIADSYKICPRCHKLRFLELSWAGQLKAARQRAPSVSSFLESEYDPFESLPELSGYKQSVQAKRLMNEFKAHMITYWPYEKLRNVILPAAANDPALFMGLLYSSCCHLEAVRGGGESALSIAIKSEAMRQINIRLNDPEKMNTSITIASIAYMSSGVFANGSAGVMEETNAHEQGMELLFFQGLGGVIAEDDAVGQALLKCLIIHKMSRAATLAQPIPPAFIAAFCHPSREFLPTEWLPESPVFCPRSDFFTLKKSPKCSIYTLRVVRLLKKFFDWLLDETDLTLKSPFDFEVFKQEIILLPQVTSKSAPLPLRGDYIYNSILITAQILIDCLANSVTFSLTSPYLVTSLQASLKKTDIGSCWGSLSGLFFFVAMIASASAVRRKEHPFMSSVIARADHEIVYGNEILEAAAGAAWRVWRVHCILVGRWEEEKEKKRMREGSEESVGSLWDESSSNG